MRRNEPVSMTLIFVLERESPAGHITEAVQIKPVPFPFGTGMASFQILA